MRKILLFFGFYLVIFNVTHGIFCKDFVAEWKKMQDVYMKLLQTFSPNRHDLQQKYVLPDWKKYQDTIAKIIMNGPNAEIVGRPSSQFLLSKSFLETMLRQQFLVTQQIELNYLNYFLSPKNKSLVSKFEDSSFGGISFDCSERKCSVNTLGQLFYFAKIIEQKDYESIGSIVEFGSGYGCLCRITKMLLPNTTYIMIDLPEFLAIQSFYLNMTLDNAEIIVHYTVPQSYKPGAIHLIPVFLLEDLDIRADVFISPFTLPECSSITQQLVIEKEFFNASLCYATGLIDKRGTADQYGVLSNYDMVARGIKKLYTHSYYKPFHEYYDGTISSYEIIGVK